MSTGQSLADPAAAPAPNPLSRRRPGVRAASDTHMLEVVLPPGEGAPAWGIGPLAGSKASIGYQRGYAIIDVAAIAHSVAEPAPAPPLNPASRPVSSNQGRAAE
jgi:hypothetical protein